MEIIGRTTTFKGEPLPIMQVAARLADLPVRLRWGGPLVPGAINGDCSLLSGLQQLTKFKERGVPTVEFTNDPNERDQWVEAGFTVLGRKLYHTQGRDIVTPGHKVGCNQRGCECKPMRWNKRWCERDYWVKYLSSRSEWRMHILKTPGGEYHSIARGYKTTQTYQVDGLIVRSRRNGWTLAHNMSPPKGVRSLAKQAVEVCGYDLGAVDILEVIPGDLRVLEVNSRPAIRDEYTIGKYVDAIRLNYGG